ncbi:MAG TPA: 2-dehydropantoate 2-reductase N-terminal domain-containing protein, partial [Pseudomonadota bacterium]|nr:2-dehydropantoate 2-reductase N-terminal domain-containing protein [Pseudomonadota bacterium]
MATEAKVLLVGCGGIGGIAAAQLSRAGCDVTVVPANATAEDVLRHKP